MTDPTTPTNPTVYRIGDVVNGHVLTAAAGWQPVQPDTGYLVPETATGWDQQPASERSYGARAAYAKPKPPWYRRTWVAVAAAAVIGLGVGGALGATDTPEPRTITKTVEVEKPVPTTPAVCTQALDAAEALGTSAEKVIDLTADTLALVEPGINAAFSDAVTGGTTATDGVLAQIESNGAELEAMTPTVQAQRAAYDAAAAECRATP